MSWLEEERVEIKIDDLGDAELLSRVQQKEDPAVSGDAIGVIFRRYRGDVARYVYARLEDECEAGEVEVAVWDLVYRKIYKFQWTGTPLKHWIMAIAKRQTSQFIKHRDERIIYFEDFVETLDTLGHARKPWAAHPSEDEELDQRTHQILFVQFLRRLKLHEQKILLLTQKGWNASQIAAELGLKPATVRQTKKRAIAKMKAMYDEQEEGQEHVNG